MRKITGILLFVSACTVILPGVAPAQTADKSGKIRAAMPVIEKLLKEYADKYHLPGFAYGVIADGKLAGTVTYGYGNLEKKIPVDTKSAFRIASMTKSFISVAILKLRDEGKIRLDDPAYLYIPELKDQHYLTEDASLITIRQLLTHTAGFPEDNPWGDRQLAISDEQMIAMIKKGISFSNVPGRVYEYSNMGFAMLGYIIKKISGKTYEDYITENVLLPLGMKDTYWEYAKVPEKQLVKGYRLVDGKYIEQPMLHDGAYGAMGGMITSMEDFAKYAAFHLDAWPPRNGKENTVLKRSSVREMQYPWVFNTLNADYKYPGGRACPTTLAYGYGLRWSKDCQGREITGHSGGLPGFGSNWMVLPDYGIGVIFFGNHTYAPGTLINYHIIDTLLAVTGLKPDKVPVSKILNQRKEELTTLLPAWKNAEQSGIFAENFFSDYFIDALRKESATIFDRAGKIIKANEMVAENNLRGYFILDGEKADVKISFTLSPENPPLIQHYTIELIDHK